MARKRTDTNEFTPRQQVVVLPGSGFEPGSTRRRKPEPREKTWKRIKGVGRRLAAARHAGQSKAGPNYLLEPLNRLRERQQRGPLDEAAWQRLVAELAALLPKNRFLIPATMPHVGRPLAWTFQAIDDLATRGKTRKVSQRLLAHYVHDFEAKEQAAFQKVQPPGLTLLTGGLLSGPDRRPPLPSEANLEAMVYGFNCSVAKDIVLEFWHAPKAWRRRLRICSWRRCQKVYVTKDSSKTCGRVCAASLSRERNRST